VSIKANFGLGQLHPDGKPLAGKAVEVQL